MPITYQRLGNSGGGIKLLINGDPHKEVTLTGNEYRRTLTTNDSGNVVFPILKSGTYTIEATLANDKKYTKQVTVFNEFHEILPKKQVKDLPLKSKIKLSNGLKMIFMNKNLKTHPSNSATFVSEFAVDSYTWDWEKSGAGYLKNDMNTKICSRYYNTLAPYEKQAILVRQFKHLWRIDKQKQDENITARFYIPSYGEVGGRDEYGIGSYEVNIGFDDSSRKKKTEDGTPTQWTTRTSLEDSYNDGQLSQVVIVEEEGRTWRRTAFEETGINTGYRELHPLTYALVPACDISLDAYVALDSDGYYRILGM